MLELFLRLLERLEKVISLRSERMKDEFRELYEPLFSDMAVIHQDYLRMFTEAHVALATESSEAQSEEEYTDVLRAAIRKLEVDRAAYEPLRRKVPILVRELELGHADPENRGSLRRTPAKWLWESSADHRAVEHFLAGVLMYFPPQSPIEGPLPDTHTGTLLGLFRELLQSVREHGEESAYCSKMVQLNTEMTLHRIRNRWLRIVKAFAELKRHTAGK